jgi:hypothetical protein
MHQSIPSENQLRSLYRHSTTKSLWQYPLGEYHASCGSPRESYCLWQCPVLCFATEISGNLLPSAAQATKKVKQAFKSAPVNRGMTSAPRGVNDLSDTITSLPPDSPKFITRSAGHSVWTVVQCAGKCSQASSLIIGCFGIHILRKPGSLDPGNNSYKGKSCWNWEPSLAKYPAWRNYVRV